MLNIFHEIIEHKTKQKLNRISFQEHGYAVFLLFSQHKEEGTEWMGINTGILVAVLSI